MADVTWFKVLTDIFSDDKIKIIQSMPEGDALLVMWFKVLSQAGKTNDGGYIYLRKNIPYTPAMLATLFNKSQMIVELALKLFVEFEMIDIDDNGYLFVTNWERHQSIDALEKIKEQTKLRVKNHRDKKKQELLESSVTVTLPKRTSNATELEVDIELEKEKITATTSNSFLSIIEEYCKLHNKGDWQVVATDRALIYELLESIKPEFVISTMKSINKKSNKKINTFSYYTEAIKESWRGMIEGETNRGNVRPFRNTGTSNTISDDEFDELQELQRAAMQNL